MAVIAGVMGVMDNHCYRFNRLEERGEEEEEGAEEDQLVHKLRRKSQRLSRILPYDTWGQAG